MGRKKLLRFREIESFENVFCEPGELNGRWSGIFKNKNKIILELGCGAGHYTLALAREYANKNFIGVDRKADRIWRGAKIALTENLKNAKFIKGFIENLDDYFSEGEVSEIWITFPDPYGKPSRAMRRLSSTKFLEIYRKVLAKKGVIHLKTDDEKLFNFSIRTARENGMKIEKELRDIHSLKNLPKILKIKTFYEEKFLKEGRKIFYLRIGKWGSA